MNAAYKSGHVFTGELHIPILDIRIYLEPVLDMHHSQGSFAARARMIDAKGHADNQVIWFVKCSNLDTVSLDADCAYDPTGDALDVIDEWMAKLHGRSARQVVKRKPAAAQDSCFQSDGTLLHAGADAWDGILNNNPDGPCTMAFPIFSTSRIAAGGSIKDDIFKCARKPVRRALRDGTYRGIRFSKAQRARLKEIFPSGVCDYSKPDVGRPMKPNGKKGRHRHTWH